MQLSLVHVPRLLIYAPCLLGCIQTMLVATHRLRALCKPVSVSFRLSFYRLHLHATNNLTTNVALLDVVEMLY